MKRHKPLGDIVRDAQLASTQLGISVLNAEMHYMTKRRGMRGLLIFDIRKTITVKAKSKYCELEEKAATVQLHLDAIQQRSKLHALRDVQT